MVKINDEVTVKKIIDKKDIDLFARASGDYNPIHLDEEIAKESIFKKRIAHGMLSASFISAVIGNTLPGNGSIYLSQTLNFKKPVFIGDCINTHVKVVDIKKNIATLETLCINQHGQIVISGEAVVLLPKGD